MGFELSGNGTFEEFGEEGLVGDGSEVVGCVRVKSRYIIEDRNKSISNRHK